MDRPEIGPECLLNIGLRDGMVDRPGRKFEQYHLQFAEVKNE
jgi:hypothetical protein